MEFLTWLVGTWTGRALCAAAYIGVLLFAWSLCAIAGRADDATEDLRWI